MRALYFALFTALAVFFTGAGAWAQRADECGVNWSPRGSFMTDSDREAATLMATRHGEVHWRETPGQSRAPTACEDPNDPRCHVEQADPPGRVLPFGAVGADALAAMGWDLDVPWAVEVDVDFPATERGGPRAGHALALLRPPAR
ncbi:MAG: hypothetical protein U0325_17485 [Polyangiales bacterium]